MASSGAAASDLDREQIQALLTELGEVMAKQGLRADVFLVGGAALALAFDARRVTRDLDGVFAPAQEVRRAAAAIAQRHELDDDWLNDAVKGFLPEGQPSQRVILEQPGIRVSVPSPDYLLALKVVAARVDRDVDDITFLAELCGYTTADEVLDCAQRWFPQHRIQTKAQFLVEELFQAPLDFGPPLQQPPPGP